jgi:hypothetical protein
MKKMGKHDKFRWGEHAGETLLHVMMFNVSYITWCIDNVSSFEMDNEAYEMYEKYAEQPFLNSHLRR